MIKQADSALVQSISLSTLLQAVLPSVQIEAAAAAQAGDGIENRV